jgi:mono/diheme cytochrome c family protein
MPVALLTLLTAVWLALLAQTPHAGSSVQPPATTAAPRSPVHEFLAAHCLACHNDRARVAGLSLAALDPARVTADAEIWEKVLHKLRTGQMPPPGRPRPDASAARAVTTAIAADLDRAAAASPDPGRVGLHRLNRAEYANAIRDLFGLEIDTRALLLPDEADEGFDNVAASLAVSPAHLERYLAAAREISRLAAGDRSVADAPASAIYRVPKLLEQDVRVSDDTPFGARGGLAVRHTFPLDGEDTFKIRLRRQVYDYIIGMGHAQAVDLRIDGTRVRRFTVGGEATGTPGPLTWNGEIVGETAWELYMHAADAGLETRTRVPAGTHLVSVSFAGGRWLPEGVTQPLQVDFGRGSDEQYDGLAAVDALTIQGPFHAAAAGAAPGRPAAFACRPARAADERPCATRILSSLARRAYRRAVTQDEVATLLRFYDAARGDGDFAAGMQAAIERMLVSFNFLFRIETDPAAAGGRAHRLSDVELASRLSFFLWSSIPDDELLTLAIRGRLQDPAVLEQQVRRMLRDPRARALVDNFGSQWLQLRKADSVIPDPNIFPEFDENLRRAMRTETALFLESQLRDDRPIADLLAADYSFLNERLAEHYGVSGVTGERFRRVTFTDPARGGLLGQGSILLVTSYPDRTTPVLRGFWVLESLLGIPPPPPPPNVPDLSETTADGRPLSIREQMEAHRRNPACAVCHVRMDPVGFALENFDAIGRWRTTAGGRPIDASAEFADGTPIAGAAGLRRFLLDRQDLFVETFATKLLTYALGRRVDYRDQPSIRTITREARAGGHRWSAIVLAIVRSTPFQMRKAAS